VDIRVETVMADHSPFMGKLERVGEVVEMAARGKQ
jgi:hypothetical protein